MIHSIHNRHGLRIAVEVEIPENPVGVLFIVHGWKSSRQSNSPTVFAKTGLVHRYVAVRFDCTHSSGESDGTIEKSTISSFIDDLDDVVIWATTQPWFRTPYMLAGSSLGGITILEHAHKNPQNVAALAPVATVISGTLSIAARAPNDAERQENWRKTGWEEQDTSAGSAIFPWSHMEDRLRYDALAYASQLTMPVFMCVGSQDLSCPPDHQKILYDRLSSTLRELHIINGAPHRLKEATHLEQLKARFNEWLASIA